MFVGCVGTPESGGRAGPLRGLPECTPLPSPLRAIEVAGLIAPPGTVLTRSKAGGRRLTNVRGFVEMTPIQVRRFYASLRGRPGYEFFLLEDEVFEAEALLTDGKHRTYMRARATCSTRSDIFAIVAPEEYGKKVKLGPRTASPTP